MNNDLFDIIDKNVVNFSIQPNYYFQKIKNVVAVSGAAALGKTTFCKNLYEYYKRKGYGVIHIELDGYLKDRKVRQSEKISGYDPRATKLDNLMKDLTDILINGNTINIPFYSHKSGSITENIKIAPEAVVILDGIVALHYEIRNLFPSFNIFIEADEITMKGLRIDVDLKERGYNIFQSLSHIDTESREYDRWIHHQSEFANIRIGVISDRHMFIKYSKDVSY